MIDEYEIECIDCGWIGGYSDLQCSDEDAGDGAKPVDLVDFNRCPGCGEADCFEEIEGE